MKTVDMLQQMHAENRADHADLTKHVDAGFASINTALAVHTREDDKRFGEIRLELQPLVQLHKGVVWAKRTLYGAAALALVTELVHIAVTHPVK